MQNFFESQQSKLLCTKISNEVEEDLRNLAFQLYKAEFKPSDQHTSQYDAIKATVSAMRRHEVDISSIHSAIREFIEVIDDEDSVVDNNNTIPIGVMQEKEDLERDFLSLQESENIEDLFFLTQVRCTERST